MGHMSVIDATSQAYVLESVMADSEGKPTYALLRGASYLKDNRLLRAPRPTWAHMSTSHNG